MSKWLFRFVNKSTKSRYHKDGGNPFHIPWHISKGLIPSGHEMFVEPLTALDTNIRLRQGSMVIENQWYGQGLDHTRFWKWGQKI